MCQKCEKDQDKARVILDKALLGTMKAQVPPNQVLVVLYEKVKQLETIMSRIPRDEVVEDASFDIRILKNAALTNCMLRKGVQFDDFPTPPIDKPSDI